MIVGVPKETFPDERRVALVPGSLTPLTKAGVEILVEAGAGLAAGSPDPAYAEKGARIVPTRAEVFARADVVLQVRAAGAAGETGTADLDLLRRGQVVIGHADPLGAPEAIRAVAAQGAVLFGMELVPRITRAQSMDVLSSQAMVAGYKAVLLAADTVPRLFSMEMTAAGTLQPAHVFVIGAGVAGLKAIATAKRLGAVVKAYDVRPAVKEQVESLGGKFVAMEAETTDAEDKGGYAREMDEAFYRRQRELMARVAAESHAAVTTAAIPGKPSPLLVTADAVKRMRAGSVIVDLAAERGGNCELTQADQTIVAEGVTILGPTNLPSEAPQHASQMYAKNLVNFLLNMTKDGQLDIDPSDEIVRDTLAAKDGQVHNQRLRDMLELGPLVSPATTPPVDHLAGE